MIYSVFCELFFQCFSLDIFLVELNFLGGIIFWVGLFGRIEFFGTFSLVSLDFLRDFDFLGGIQSFL